MKQIGFDRDVDGIGCHAMPISLEIARDHIAIMSNGTDGMYSRLTTRNHHDQWTGQWTVLEHVSWHGRTLF